MHGSVALNAGSAAVGTAIAINGRMRIAVAHWQDRVSPVFDVSDTLLLIDIENDREFKRRECALRCRGAFERAAEVQRLGVRVLICGAISRALETALISTGVEVSAFVCGDLQEVITAYRQGRLTDKRFQMPGYGQKKSRRPVPW
jgi:predicted Fe-Mo cluster-binding NifX family protein